MTTNVIIENTTYDLPALRKKAKAMMEDECLGEFRQGVWGFIDEWLNDSRTVNLQTSGSTGAPKQITMEKKYMRQSARMTLDFLALSPNDTALCCLSASYIAGKMMIVRALEGGLNLLLSEPNGNPLKEISTPIDFAAMVPMQVENVLKDKPKDLNKVKHLILGGAPVSPALEKQLQDFKTAIWHTYGMTETVSHIAMRRLNGAGQTSYYSAMANVKLSLDERQCLQIEAPHLTAEKVVTNDIVELDDKGNFRFLGRYDNVINSGGVKISPELLEQKIAHLIPCRFLISSVPDERLGQRVVLVLEGDDKMMDGEALLGELRKKLSTYETPKELVFIEQFQETGSGKIKRL